MDGTKVAFKTSGGRLLESEIMTKNGRARAILVASEKPQSATITAAAGSISAQTSVRFGIPKTPLLLVKVTDDSGIPVAGACVILRKKEVSVSDEKGRTYVKANNSGTAEYTIIKKGFSSVSLKAKLISGSLVTENVIMKLVDGGIFFNKIIMLDPAGSSEQSFALLNELQKMIEYAGGTVFFTWQDEPPQSLKERVIEGARVKADLFLTAEITSKTLSAEYYYKSELGKAMADGICRGFTENRNMKAKKCLSVDSTNYLLVQTSMPAIWLKIPQKLLHQPSIAAATIYQGIMDFFKTKDVLNKK
jgi:hypothetical protein